MKKIFLFTILFTSILMSQESKSSIIKSIILPGWGQLNENHKNSAKQFLFQESILWISLSILKNTSNFYDHSYKAFALDNAGINLFDFDLQMAVDVGNYSNLVEFNDNKERRRQFDLILDENDVKNYWSWNSDYNREKFKKMRINSGISKKISSFMIAGLIGHRIVSAIHVKYIQNYSMPKLGYQVSQDGSKTIKLFWRL